MERPVSPQPGDYPRLPSPAASGPSILQSPKSPKSPNSPNSPGTSKPPKAQGARVRFLGEPVAIPDDPAGEASSVAPSDEHSAAQPQSPPGQDPFAAFSAPPEEGREGGEGGEDEGGAPAEHGGEGSAPCASHPAEQAAGPAASEGADAGDSNAAASARSITVDAIAALQVEGREGQRASVFCGDAGGEDELYPLSSPRNVRGLLQLGPRRSTMMLAGREYDPDNPSGWGSFYSMAQRKVSAARRHSSWMGRRKSSVRPHRLSTSEIYEISGKLDLGPESDEEGNIPDAPEFAPGDFVLVMGASQGRVGRLGELYEGNTETFRGGWWVEFLNPDMRSTSRQLVNKVHIHFIGRWLRLQQRRGRRVINTEEEDVRKQLRADMIRTAPKAVRKQIEQCRRPSWLDYVQRRSGASPWHAETLRRVQETGGRVVLPDAVGHLIKQAGAKHSARWARPADSSLRRPKAAALHPVLRPIRPMQAASPLPPVQAENPAAAPESGQPACPAAPDP